MGVRPLKNVRRWTLTKTFVKYKKQQETVSFSLKIFCWMRIQLNVNLVECDFQLKVIFS